MERCSLHRQPIPTYEEAGIAVATDVVALAVDRIRERSGRFGTLERAAGSRRGRRRRRGRRGRSGRRSGRGSGRC